jgi:CubicO group peptidase (beta-lactamase class C family)
MRVFVTFAGLALAAASQALSAIDESTVQTVLSKYTEWESKKWNMSIAAAFYSPSILPGSPLISDAAGLTNGGLLIKPSGPPRSAKTDDLYVWGSITKMFTGPAVLQLVDKGVVNLADKIASHIDPFLKKANGTTLSDHFGADIDKVEIHHLLHMTSGIGDYDRGNYSKDQFASPTHDFSPIEILGKYVPSVFDWEPGSKQSYCSTNYILLGMVLANHLTTDANWQNYDQRTVFPESIRASLNKSMFIDKGSCSEYTPVHGIMAPSFYDPSAKGDTDVWNVSCVGGWTAGNFVGAVTDVSRYTYALYKPDSDIVSDKGRANMINFTAPSSHGE